MAKRANITLMEFNRWLEGIEEFKDRNWAPSAAEWKRIRNKLKSVTVPETRTESESLNSGDQQSVMDRYDTPATGIPPMPPQIPTSVPASALAATVSPNAAASIGMPRQVGPDGQEVLKTPDIDGDYSESNFT